jgi:hypothetical protein
LQTTCPDILTCGICKSEVSISFVKQFVSLEQLMAYPNKIQEPDEIQELNENGFVLIESIIIPGIAEVRVLCNGELHYKNIKQQDRVTESAKRLHKSERHSIPSYKKPYRF